MKRFLAVLAFAAASAPALATDVGVAVTVGGPGYQGRIDIVGLPPPRLLFAEPIFIEPAPVGVVVQPVYVYVPANEAKQWRKQCKKYKLCGQPVYFVQETWYRDVYVPQYGKGKGKGKQKHDKPDKPGKP